MVSLIPLCKMTQSYIVSGEETTPVYFKAWDKTHSPITVEKYSMAKHWADKTNCIRFHKRNIHDLPQFELHRVIPNRFCTLCGALLDPYSRLTKEFCTDKCKDDFNNSQRSK